MNENNELSDDGSCANRERIDLTSLHRDSHSVYVAYDYIEGESPREIAIVKIDIQRAI